MPTTVRPTQMLELSTQHISVDNKKPPKIFVATEGPLRNPKRLKVFRAAPN